MPDLARHALILGAGFGLLVVLGALLPRPRLGPVAALPATAANALAALTFLAFLADAFGVGLRAVDVALVATALAAAAWRLRWIARRGVSGCARTMRVLRPGAMGTSPGPASGASKTGAASGGSAASLRHALDLLARAAAARSRVSGGDAACYAVALLAVGLALWSGTWLSHSADSFYHLAAARAQVLDDAPLAHRVFVPEPAGADPTSGSWHTAVAVLAWLTRQDVASVWVVLAPVLAGLEVLSLAALGRAASGSGWAGALGALAYVTLERRLDLRTAPFPNEVAWVPLAAGLTAALAWLRWPAERPPYLPVPASPRRGDTGTRGHGGTETRRGLAVAVGAWFAAAAGVHLAVYAVGVALLVAVAVAAVAVPALRRRRAAGGALLAVGASLVGGALPTGYRLTTLLATPTGRGALGAGEPLGQGYLAAWSPAGLGGLLVLADPGVWFRTTAVLLAGLATLVLLRRAWAGHAGAALLLIGAWSVPAVLLNPLLAPWVVERFSYPVAKAATVLRPLPYLGAAWGLLLMAGTSGSRLGTVARAVVIAGLLLAAALESPRIAATTFGAADPQQHSVAAGRAGDLRVRWADLLAALDALPGRAVILSDPETSYAVAGLTRHWVVAVPVSHTPAQVEARDGALRRGDALDAFYQGAERAAEALERYGATHVLATDALAGAVGNLPFLVRVAAGGAWQLYAYDALRLGAALNVPAVEIGSGIRAGVLRPLVPAGGVVFVRVAGHRSPARLELRRGAAVLVERAVPARDDAVIGLPVPLEAPVGPAELRLLWDGRALDVATLTLGRQVEAELLAGVRPNRDYDYGRLAGWASYSMSFFSRQRAATATATDERVRGVVAGLPPGDYLLQVRVYDYGNGRLNSLGVRLGGASTLVTWGGAIAGMRWLETTIRGVASDEIEVRVERADQGRIVLDALVLYPL